MTTSDARGAGLQSKIPIKAAHCQLTPITYKCITTEWLGGNDVHLLRGVVFLQAKKTRIEHKVVSGAVPRKARCCLVVISDHKEIRVNKKIP